MELVQSKTKVILTEEEAKMLLGARELLDAIYQEVENDPDLEQYSRDARDEIGYFLDEMNIEVEVHKPGKCIVVTINEINL